MGLFECFTQPRKSKHEIELKAAYSYLHKKCEKYRFNPTLAVVCGSGLSKLNESSNVFFEIKYCDVPHMPVSTVPGHEGKFCFGKIKSTSCVFMIGRIHPYEGYSPQQVAFPIRLLSMLGVKTLIVTNASGAINRSYNIGDIMIIEDHINMAGISGFNPLVGPNLDKFGPRFPSIVHAYDQKLAKKVQDIAMELKETDKIKSGVYVCVFGPSYESKAEIRAYNMLGGDAVGMSTVHEVIAAVHAGMQVLGLCFITNICKHNLTDPSPDPSHEEVLHAVKEKGKLLQNIVISLIQQIKTT